MKIRVFVYWKYLKVSRCFFKYKQRDVFLYTKGCIVAQDDGERCPNKVAGVVPPDGCRCSLRCGTRPDGCIPENPSFRYGVLAGRRVRMPEADPVHLSSHSSISSGSDLRFPSATLHVPVRSSSRLRRKWPSLPGPELHLASASRMGSETTWSHDRRSRSVRGERRGCAGERICCCRRL